jgi:uncharacterized membrane protein (GlpM family)
MMAHRVGPWAGTGRRGMSWVGRLDVWALPIVALVVLLGSPLLAWAHSDPLAQSMAGAIPWAPAAFMLTMLMAVAGAHGLRQWRRVVIAGLVLILGTFAFGTAVHAVHHLTEPQNAAECPVFSASQHITGTLAEPSALHVPVVASGGTSSGACEAPTFTPCFQPAQPRAPPLSLAL